MTDMNQVLGTTAGNAVEVVEAIEFLGRGSRDARLERVTLALGASLLVLGGLAPDEAAAARRLGEVLSSGAAAERFQAMVAALGGPSDLLERAHHYLPRAPVVREVPAPESGFVRRIETRETGLVVVALGGGRRRPGDDIDPRVGLTAVAAPGTRITRGDPLALVHAGDEASAEAMAARLGALIEIGETPPPEAPVLIERIG